MITEAAVERLFTSVSPLVNFEICWSFEALFTEVALEIPVLAVTHFVFPQTFHAIKGLLTNVTGRWLLTIVICKLFLGLKALWAVRAFEWFPACSSCHMPWNC